MNPGITYQVEFSSDLINWTAGGVLLSTTPIDSTWEQVRFEDFVTSSQASARYCRVTVRP